MWTPLNKMGLQKEKIDISLRLPEFYSSKCLFLSLIGGKLFNRYLINRLPSRILNGVSPTQLMTTFYPSVPIITSLQSSCLWMFCLCSCSRFPLGKVRSSRYQMCLHRLCLKQKGVQMLSPSKSLCLCFQRCHFS